MPCDCPRHPHPSTPRSKRVTCLCPRRPLKAWCYGAGDSPAQNYATPPLTTTCPAARETAPHPTPRGHGHGTARLSRTPHHGNRTLRVADAREDLDHLKSQDKHCLRRRTPASDFVPLTALLIPTCTLTVTPRPPSCVPNTEPNLSLLKLDPLTTATKQDQQQMSLPPTCPHTSLSVAPKPGNFSPSCTSQPLEQGVSAPANTEDIDCLLSTPASALWKTCRDQVEGFFYPNGRAVPWTKELE